jgi:hypothetical protein
MTPEQSAARQQIEKLTQLYKSFDANARKAMTEASVVRQFVDPLLKALGWPIEDPQRYKYELYTEAGRPDITLLPERGGAIFLEAKRFGLISELKEARRSISGIVTPGQLALPGMAVDRTPQEQQAINYAFQNGGTWAILTNFEKLRLFNARRDWLVLSFEAPFAYLDEFDLLWQLSYERVIDGGLDRLSEQRHRADVDEAYLQFINTWRERLAQDIVAHRDANPWAFRADGAIDVQTLRSVVQRILDRLVVVRFAEDHLIAPPGTLQSIYDLRQRNPYTFPLNQSYAQMFRVFDDLHNSGLFAYGLADQAVVSDDVLGGLTAKLYEARYRALSADIMGNTYEQYLGKTLVQVGDAVITADNLETRKKQGSYYTPQVIVQYLVDNALGRQLYATADGKPDGPPLPNATPKTADEIRDLRVIDMACGSGSFLIYAYQVLADFYRREIARLDAAWHARLDHLLRAERATPLVAQTDIELRYLKTEKERLESYPGLILENHLYGVDLDPQAAEIATVNLMMRAMADLPAGQRRLPLILNQNVKAGNSLIGAGPEDARLDGHAAALAELRALRLALAHESDNDPHDARLARIRALTAQVTDVLDADLAAHFDDVAGQRPFHWAVEFPEVFVDAEGRALGEAGGFDIIVGNPPWEIVKPDLREYYAQFDERIESKLNREQAEARIAELNARDPAILAGWERQQQRIEAAAAYYKRSRDYGRQGRGDTATHKLFLQRSYALLARHGRLALVIPAGIYTDLGTKELRQMLFEEGRIEYLYSFSNERFFFPAVDHRVKFVLLGAQRGETGDGFWATFRFDPRVAVRPVEMAEFLADPSNLIYLKLETVERLSPDALAVFEFKDQLDYSIAEKVYGSHPLLGDLLPGCWNVKFTREFDKTNDRDIFNYAGIGLPVLQGANLGFYGEVLEEPTIWIDEDLGRSRLLATIAKATGGADLAEAPLDYECFRFGFRRIARATDTRTLYVSWLPKRYFAMYTLTTTVQHYFDGEKFVGYMTQPQQMFLYACMASYCLDFIMRFQVSTSVAMFNAYSLPVPRLTVGNPYFDAIVPRAARLTCTRPEFADLWQAVMGEAWTPASGVTDPVARQQLRNELDALVAHLYGLSRGEFAHILGAFPLVFPDDAQGRAKRAALLAVYDKMG